MHRIHCELIRKGRVSSFVYFQGSTPITSKAHFHFHVQKDILKNQNTSTKNVMKLMPFSFAMFVCGMFSSGDDNDNPDIEERNKKQKEGINNKWKYMTRFYNQNDLVSGTSLNNSNRLSDILSSLARNHRVLLEGKCSTLDDRIIPVSVHSANPKTQVKKELEGIVGPDRIFDDIQNTSSRGKPWSSYHKPTHYPQIVVLPHSTEEVVQILKVAKKYHFPIVPYGSGTSLEGHILSEKENTISIDFSQMTTILQINLEDEDVTVQPGIDYLYLNSCLKPHGIFFPLDPGPGASIGGMCGTRCSGSMAVKYGTMKDNVLKLKAVLIDGRVIETATRARKSAAGYDLTR